MNIQTLIQIQTFIKSHGFLSQVQGWEVVISIPCSDGSIVTERA